MNNKKVKSRRKSKKAAWNKYKSSKKDEALYSEYQDKLNKSVAENRKAKTKFEEQLAHNIKNDTKSFFAYANVNKKAKKRINPLIDDNRNIMKIMRMLQIISINILHLYL